KKREKEKRRNIPSREVPRAVRRPRAKNRRQAIPSRAGIQNARGIRHPRAKNRWQAIPSPRKETEKAIPSRQGNKNCLSLLCRYTKIKLPASRGTGDINSKAAVTLSPGITIFTFSGSSTLPVTSAVLMKNWGM
ncbi:hypothetical protein GW17_00021293, partial [Ensete ventricosum]